MRRYIARLSLDCRYCLGSREAFKLFQMPRQRTKLRILKQRSQRNFAPQCARYQRERSRRQQRVASKLEEIVVHADPIDLEQPRPDLRKLRLKLRPRRNVLLAAL